MIAVALDFIAYGTWAALFAAGCLFALTERGRDDTE